MHSIRMRGAAAAKLTVAAVIAIAAAPHPLRAQTLPSGKSLMEKHDATVGGRAAMDKHTSMHETVAISIAAANMTGTMETFHSKPDLYMFKQSSPAGDVTSGYDGKIAWSAAGSGAQLLSDDAATEMKTQADFFADYYDPAKIKSAETLEVTDFEGARCYKVKVIHTNDKESTIYFDSATGLRAGQVESAKMMGQDMMITVVMSDYKDVGGVKMPMKRVMKLPINAEIVMQVTSVDFDKVPASAYALPDAVKALVKP